MTAKYKCPQCNAEFEQGVNYCPNCGYDIKSNFAQSPVCPHCHTSYPTGYWFCPIDGFRLVAGTVYPNDINISSEEFAEAQVDAPSKDVSMPSNAVTNANPVSDAKAEKLGNGGMQRKSLPKASLGRRFVACLIDGFVPWLFIILALVVISLLFDNTPDPYDPLDEGRFSTFERRVLVSLALMLCLIAIIYSFVKDGFWEGQSVGKRIVGLKVVKVSDRTKCSFGRSSLRALVTSLFCLTTVGALIDIILVLVSDDGRKVGDLVTGLQVVECR